tara:strand:+ start:89 stop:409 length:321 start_codon:yes stop_codon:yes gene_type:complete
MTKIIFIDSSGNRQTVDAKNDQSVMQAAVDNMITGIPAECGGCLSCATCHSYIGEAWLDIVPAALDDETAMLECAFEAKDNSRLTCQINVTDALDGLEVHIPESQY